MSGFHNLHNFIAVRKKRWWSSIPLLSESETQVLEPESASLINPFLHLPLKGQSETLPRFAVARQATPGVSHSRSNNPAKLDWLVLLVRGVCGLVLAPVFQPQPALPEC